MAKVSDLLSGKGPQVHAIGPDEPVLAAIQIMADKSVGALLVMREGALAGIVSERDIVKALAAHGADCLTQAVASVMSNPVRTCRISDPIDHVMHLMTAGRFRHVPVVENRELKGVVSIGDVVKLKIAETELEVAAMRDYIAAH